MTGLILYTDPSVRRHLRDHFPEFAFSDDEQLANERHDALVRWGPSGGPDLARAVINRGSALRDAADEETMLNLLRLGGVKTQRALRKTPSGIAPYTAVNSAYLRRRYRVYVFDLRCIAIYRKRGGKYHRIAEDLSSETVERAKSAATRATYTLGLHVAAVDVGMVNEWRPVVCAVDTAPKLTRSLGDLYAAAIRAHVSRRGTGLLDGVFPGLRQEVVLGADPEFMVRNRHTGKMVPASRLFPKAGPIGCDDRALRGNTVRLFPLAEVRPQPTSSPAELVRNIRACLNRACTFATPKELKATRWEAGSMPFRGYPIGGHIHFSNVDLTSDLLRSLDNYLALPCMLIEHDVTAVQRRRRYGHLGDHRAKEHGGFEYRTLGSWLMSPSITTAVICLAKLVATEYRRLGSSYLDSYAAQRAFYRCDRAYFQEVFPRLWADLEATSSYREYAEELQTLRDFVEGDRRWKESLDIKKTWSLM